MLYYPHDPGLAGNSPNRYLYAYNSPLLVKDPTGRAIPVVVLVGAAVIGAAIDEVSGYVEAQGPDSTIGGTSY